MANHYIRDELPFNKRNGKRKSKGAVYNYQHSLDELILPRCENEVRPESSPCRPELFYSIHDEQDNDWPTVSKIKMIMEQVFSHADMYDLENCRNPIQKVMIPGSENADRKTRVLQSEETLEIVSRLEFPEKVLVVLITATAARISKALALQWKAHKISMISASRLSKRFIWQRSPPPRPNRPKLVCRVVSPVPTADQWFERSLQLTHLSGSIIHRCNRKRTAEPISLGLIATCFTERLGLGGCFYSLGRDHEIQRPSHCHDCVYDRCCFGIELHLHHERTIDLYRVKKETSTDR